MTSQEYDTMHSPDQIQPNFAAEFMAEMDDATLVQWARTAQDDLAEAANTQRESEWHNACFAACFVLGQEIIKRGIDLRTLN